MTGSLTGKVALVSGGARGQGRAHALALAREGADVAIIDISANVSTVPYGLATSDDLLLSQKLVQEQGVRCSAAAVDVRDRGSLGRAVDDIAGDFGGIDIAIVNHGIIGTATPVQTLPVEQWDDVIGINLTGVFNVCRAALPHMLDRGAGRVIVTASMAGKYGVPTLADYTASKWGVIGFVKSLAIELAAAQITVNAVCPASVNTPMIHNSAFYKMLRPDLDDPTVEDVADTLLALHDQGIPWLEPEDITDAVMFLCSDAAKRITGETISVSGGQSAHNSG
jgi:SDR family mycofactocin-dependent oxidoreductase